MDAADLVVCVGYDMVEYDSARWNPARDKRIVHVDSAPAEVDAHYVLAAGIQSRSLSDTVGISLPLYPLKGYSLTAPIRADDVAPEISVTDFERKVLYARIGDKLRVAAMVDMVGEDLSHTPKRVEGLIRQVKETMPRAACCRCAPRAGTCRRRPGSRRAAAACA